MFNPVKEIRGVLARHDKQTRAALDGAMTAAEVKEIKARMNVRCIDQIKKLTR